MPGPLFFGSIAIATFAYQNLFPKVSILGITRKVPSVGTDNCIHINLEACEDAWVSEAGALAYLPCSSLKTRAYWTPALMHLDATSLPPKSTDTLQILDLADTPPSHHEVTITGTPADWPGIYVHGIDGQATEDGHVTLFLNSHRPPQDRARAPELGADSVIEILEGETGAHEIKWVKTVRHPLIITPNNIASVGPRQFYFTNDHATKTHWTRKLDAIYPEDSNIVYCDASGKEPECNIAFPGINMANGIALGPNNTLYSASTIGGIVSQYHIGENHTLESLGGVNLRRMIDNIHVDPHTGAIYAATLPKILDFVHVVKEGANPSSTATSGVEVWRIANNTVDENVMETSLVLADPGEKISSITTAAIYKNWIITTGLSSSEVVMCKIAV